MRFAGFVFSIKFLYLIDMKVTISRASDRSEEYESDLDISRTLVEQLLNLGGEVPIAENSGSWDAGKDKSETLIINIDPMTKEVEIMIYDYYVE